MIKKFKRKVLLVVMDGIGLNPSKFGNAVALANTPILDYLQNNVFFTSLMAHGTYVGLPSDDDIGNSEVGHNAIGAGRIYDQGAKLVNKAIATQSLFQGDVWLDMIKKLNQTSGALHLCGLLSDGNVHSHEEHLYALIRQAKISGITKVFVHVLFDGRDVGERSAEIYVKRLTEVLSEVNADTSNFIAQIASGGGRMNVTMDRYEADWSIVQRGWYAHVLGKAQYQFKNIWDALREFRKDSKLTDQFLPSFVIVDDNNNPVGPVKDGDGFIFYNFRGDRAIEICRAFEEVNFDKFDRERVPNVYFAGMMEYDGDLHIPKNYLVPPPHIDNTLGEYMADLGLRQFACSETQKFGHVTYFWNGNRSGKFNPDLEEYIEIPSDKVPFNLQPQMKAEEITDITIKKMLEDAFDFGRINYPNGDMVGHTGDLQAAIIAVETVDKMLKRLIEASNQTDIVLIITADHGNSDEMFEGKEKDWPNWQELPKDKLPKPKTAHTKNPVPFFIYDPKKELRLKHANLSKPAGLGNIANTVLDVMGLPKRDIYLPSLIQIF